MVAYQVILTSLFQKGKVLRFNFNFEMLWIFTETDNLFFFWKSYVNSPSNYA